MRTEVKLSKRLERIASFVQPGSRRSRYRHRSRLCADLAGAEGVCPSALAMDVRKGPLERAEEHVEEVGFPEKLNCACQMDWQN